MVRVTTIVLLFLTAVMLSACGGIEQLTTPSVEDRFEKGKTLYDDENYFEAINEFNVITLQFQGSAFADDAQFYLGECYFQRGEYHLAGLEYGRLTQNMPASPLVPEARFKLGLSYYMLAPKSVLDQQYTLKAIDELQSFLLYYPDNEHAVNAEGKIRELTLRLAKKEYETARLYATMDYHKAAVLYYDSILEKYHDTEYAPLAYLGKTEALIFRKRYEEALTTISRFLLLFPDSVLRSTAEKLKQSIEEESGSNPDIRQETVNSKTEILGKKNR